MPRASHKIDIANLICKFGDKHNLLDLFDEVVKPAFFDDTLRRRFSETSYLIYDAVLINFDDELKDVGIAGRFVKDTVLQSEQILQDGRLVENDQTLASSPSSVFLLVLSSHRLLFLEEHKGAPTIETFKSTLGMFLKAKHKAFIEAKRKEIDPVTQRKSSVKELYERFPYPTLKLVPIGSDASMQKFVSKFDKVQNITVRLVETNSEFDNDAFMKGLRASKEALKSRSTVLRHTNNEEGLSKTAVLKQLSAVTKQGNHDITVSGKDLSGEKLSGTNEHFKVQVPISNISQSTKDIGRAMYDSFRGLLKSKIIAVPEPQAESLNKLRQISTQNAQRPKAD